MFRIERYWHVILPAFDISAEVLARKAGLPVGIFADDPVLIDVTAWASLWDAFEAEVNQPDLALQIGKNVTLDMFDPALFAAMCSENFEQAMRRFQRYKPLMGPCRLFIESDAGFAATCHVNGLQIPPRLWGVAELVVWVSLARHLTRRPIIPMRVEAPIDLARSTAFSTYFGVPVTRGPNYRVVFNHEDVQCPIVTTDAAMWEFLEPVLEKRLADCGASASMRERVQAALVELLPSGRSELAEVATALGASARTVQRHLNAEGVTYREVLDATRAKLAKYYLAHTQMTTAEIAFLIGYDDPNSLYPAFRDWTGTTPQAARDDAQSKR